MKLPLSHRTKVIGKQVLIIAIAVLVLGLLARTLGGVDFERVWGAMQELPVQAMIAAVLLTACGYTWLIGYEYLALRYLKKRIPWPKLIFTALTAFALQRNVGPAPLTGGALRYRYYRPCGVTVADAVTITLLCGFAFTLGITLTAGLALALRPDGLAQVLAAPSWLFRAGGVALLVGLVGFLFWAHSRQRTLHIRSYSLPPPSLPISCGQLFFGVGDLAIVAATVYVLLPAQVELSYPAFLGLYVLAMVAGAISHVPGGAGVFEASLALLLPGTGLEILLASLLAFRGTYYLLPLVLMGLAVGLYELGNRLPGRHR